MAAAWAGRAADDLSCAGRDTGGARRAQGLRRGDDDGQGGKSAQGTFRAGARRGESPVLSTIDPGCEREAIRGRAGPGEMEPARRGSALCAREARRKGAPQPQPAIGIAGVLPGAGLAAAKHALAFEALDFRARVAEVSQDLGVVLAEPRSHRADSGWGYAEAGGGSGLADPAELRGVVLLEDAAGAYLGVLEEFEAGSDGGRGDIVGEQAREDFIALPFLEFGGHYFATRDGIDGAQARGLEAGVVDQILTIERAAHPGPFLVGERARGYVAILGGEDQVRTDFPVGGIAFVTDIGKGRHRLGPQVRDHRIEHRDPHVLSFAGAQ